MVTNVDLNWETKIKMFESKSETNLYLPPLIVDVDIKDETKSEQSKFEPKSDPALKVKARNKGQYKDSPPRRRYRMIRAIR